MLSYYYHYVVFFKFSCQHWDRWSRIRGSNGLEGSSSERKKQNNLAERN